jgi:hypothetical protein
VRDAENTSFEVGDEAKKPNAHSDNPTQAPTVQDFTARIVGAKTGARKRQEERRQEKQEKQAHMIS